MNLEKELLIEHSKAQASRIQQYIGNNPDRFEKLVTLFLKGPYRITQRAAWPLSLCIEQYPSLASPHLPALIKNLSKPNLHDAVKRNTVRLLQFVAIPKKHHGLTVDRCFTYLSDPKEPIAVKVFSMSVLATIAQELPDLKRELKLVIENQLPYGSAGFVSRAKRVLKQLAK